MLNEYETELQNKVNKDAVTIEDLLVLDIKSKGTVEIHNGKIEKINFKGEE